MYVTNVYGCLTACIHVGSIFRPIHVNVYVRKADNLTTILGHCHVIWELLLPGTLWATRACNGTDLTYLI